MMTPSISESKQCDIGNARLTVPSYENLYTNLKNTLIPQLSEKLCYFLQFEFA
jgi:hypothetical protein